MLVTAPVLVGGGTPFFTNLDDWVNLTLVETRAFVRDHRADLQAMLRPPA